MSYPPVAFPPPPTTSNTRSSEERAALVRSSKKLSKVLGDVPRVLEGDAPHLPELTTDTDTESLWRKRKPTHLPPLLRLSPSPSPVDGPGSPISLTNSSSTYHRRGSVLSVAPSIISNAPSTASGSSSDAPCDSALRRSKLERLRRKLGQEVPATAVFPTTPRTAVPRTPKTATAISTPKRSPRGRTRSITRRAQDDARSVTFSISSDESMHRVALSARVRVHSPHPPRARQKHIFQTGALPPVPPIPAHLVSHTSSRDDDDAGLVRPRQKMAAGSKIGGSEFKAARRAKREGKPLNGMLEPGEMVEMVGFLW